MSGRLMKWSVELSQFDIHYRPRVAMKGQAAADFIAEFTNAAEPPLPESNEDMWTLHVDGSSTKNTSGAGIVLISPDGHKFNYALRFKFPASNNEAEYEALIAGLRMARRMGADQISVHSDSQLVVEQMQGDYEARGEHMAKYCEMAQNLSRKFSKFQLQHIPRSQNEEADQLAKTASAGEKLQEIPIEELASPSIQSPDVNPVEDEAEWARPITAYLENGSLPTDRTEARRIQSRSSKFLILDGILYRRGHSSPLLRCVNDQEANYIMREIHEGICGNHSGSRSLAGKILRAGYYWPTLEADTREFVKRCDKCQRFANIPRQPAQEMTSIQSPWPFAQWGIDIIGPFPLGKGQRKFAVVAIDYFTKWAEAEALPNITEQSMKKFLWQNIVCRFGIPRVVITDNGKQFEGRQFNELCQELGISHHYSSPEHPQANGQVEVTNRSLLKIIKTKLDKAKGLWADELPNILWAYRTTERVATGQTPFSLTYGADAVIPVEIGLPNHRTQQYTPEQNEEILTEEIDLLEERRLKAAVRMASYQQRMRQYYNSRVRSRDFQVGELVLKRVNQSTRNPQEGKLGPNWEGPYQVTGYTRKGTYRLATMDGKELSHPWHIEHLRKYFV